MLDRDFHLASKLFKKWGPICLRDTSETFDNFLLILCLGEISNFLAQLTDRLIFLSRVTRGGKPYFTLKLLFSWYLWWKLWYPNLGHGVHPSEDSHFSLRTHSKQSERTMLTITTRPCESMVRLLLSEDTIEERERKYWEKPCQIALGRRRPLSRPRVNLTGLGSENHTSYRWIWVLVKAREGGTTENDRISREW